MKPQIGINPWTDMEVEQPWDCVASRYVAENNKVKNAHDQRFRRMGELIGRLPAQAEVLNITSRDGEAADYIMKLYPGTRVTNAEISAGLMAEAARLWPGIRQVKLHTYSRLPFQDHQFDAIISLETLEHVSEPVSFLSELYRVCKTGGSLVLSCPPATSELPYRLYTSLFGGHGEGPHRFLSSSEVRNLLTTSGWKLIHHEGTLLLPVGPVWMQNLAEGLIRKLQNTFVSELGIRQFYVAKRS